VHTCCPPGHGCNAPDQAEVCALDVLAAGAGEVEEAAEAMARWRSFERACELRTNKRERRFRRRAYERVRDRALIALSLQSADAQSIPSQEMVTRTPRQSARRPASAPARGRDGLGVRSTSLFRVRRARARNSGTS
jgi:hypothetical protein